jgi:hypothetical protein
MMDDRWPWEDTVSCESNRLVLFLIRISFAQQPLKQLSKWKRIFLRQDAGRVALVCALPAKLEKLSCFPNSGLRAAIAQPSVPIQPRS